MSGHHRSVGSVSCSCCLRPFNRDHAYNTARSVDFSSATICDTRAEPAMPPWPHTQHAMRRAWANLPSLSTAAALAPPITPPLLRPHHLSRVLTSSLSVHSFHTTAQLSRQRRWREGDEDRTATSQRDSTETDDDYINYTARIQPLDANTVTTPLYPPAAITSTATTTAASSSHVVHLTATAESDEPPPSSAAYRSALFAARDERRAQAALLQSVHSSGESRRVRKWQSNQKRLRTRADRRRRKYHMSQSYEREQDAKDGYKHPHLLDEQ